MKVQAVSYPYTGSRIKDKQEYNFSYLYTVDLAKQQSKEKAHKIKVATGLLALAAVLVTLFNIKGPKRLPYDIVDIPSTEKGLNKLENFASTVNELKHKVLYPLQCARKGDKHIEKSKMFKSGVILTDKSSTNLSEVTDAFMEHANELGINTVSIPRKSKRINAKGEIFEKDLKRHELIKIVYGELKNAEKHFKDTKEYTIINLGDIAKLTDLKVIKSQKSNFEAMLGNLNNKKFPGIIWAGWTTKTKDVPLFFNDLPILITKLVD